MQSTRTKIESYPAPTPLATKTDLSPQEAKAITEAVNPLITDAFALYVKTKNFHWHLYGSHFRDYHLLLDEQADAIFDSIDIMAERVPKSRWYDHTKHQSHRSAPNHRRRQQRRCAGRRDGSDLDGRQRPHCEDDTRCNHGMRREPGLCH